MEGWVGKAEAGVTQFSNKLDQKAQVATTLIQCFCWNDGSQLAVLHIFPVWACLLFCKFLLKVHVPFPAQILLIIMLFDVLIPKMIFISGANKKIII